MLASFIMHKYREDKGGYYILTGLIEVLSTVAIILTVIAIFAVLTLAGTVLTLVGCKCARHIKSRR